MPPLTIILYEAVASVADIVGVNMYIPPELMLPGIWLVLSKSRSCFPDDRLPHIDSYIHVSLSLWHFSFRHLRLYI
jgi:hypothetical protein